VFYLASNPRLFWHKLTFKIRSLQPLPRSTVHKRINGILFEFDFNYAPVIEEMFYGGYEPEIIFAMKRFLKEGDTFIDVGANIGYLSAIAMGLVGKTGQVHSFEPVPEHFQRLKDLLGANKEYHLVANRCAAGDEERTASIAVTSLPNIGWNTMVPGFMSQETIKQRVEVPTCRLDRYIREKALRRISLIKIDTEGFEFPVLKGLSGYFEETRDRPRIICEIAPEAYPLLRSTLGQLREYMEQRGYRAVSLIDLGAEIDITKLEKTTDVGFMPSWS